MNKEQLIDFARKNSDIFSIVTFGSLYDKLHDPANIYSDLDLFIFTSKPLKYLTPSNVEWVKSLGNPLSILIKTNPFEGNPICRIVFDDLSSLDLIPIDYQQFRKVKLYLLVKKTFLKVLLKGKEEQIETTLRLFAYYLHRGYAVVYDKTSGKFTNLVQKITQNYTPVKNCITYRDFDTATNDFWQCAFKMKGMIEKNDLYYALVTLDNSLKMLLIQMICWNIEARTNADTFYKGKKLAEWVDAETLTSITETFWTLNQNAAMDALIKMFNVFQDASNEVSNHYKFEKNRRFEETVQQILTKNALFQA